MMPKVGLRKEHTNMVDLMNSPGGRSGESIMMEDLLSNGCPSCLLSNQFELIGIIQASTLEFIRCFI